MLGKVVGWGVDEGGDWSEWNIWFMYFWEAVEEWRLACRGANPIIKFGWNCTRLFQGE